MNTTFKDLAIGNTYIIKEKHTSYPNIYKIRVLEKTETTLYLIYEDSGYKVRELIEKLEDKYKIIENLGNISLLTYQNAFL